MSINETMYETTMMADYVDDGEHIVVDENRKITVPENLKTIAVQGDKDIETVTIDCIRYWDGNDLSTFKIYINCELPNGDEVTYIPKQIIVNNNDYFSFEWLIGSEITPYSGKLKFWIVAKVIDFYGKESQQWSSLQNDECNIAKGGGEIYVPSVDEEKEESLKNISQKRIVEEDSEDNNGITNTDEPHIVVEKNREIFVPDNLKTIAVKGDKNVETVTVDCIRYWDGKDLSEFLVYINYTLPNGENAIYIPQEIVVKESIFSFTWLIGRHITSYVGSLTFWVSAKKLKEDGILEKQWSSLKNNDCVIADGGTDEIYTPENSEDVDLVGRAIESAKIATGAADRAEDAADRAVQIESITKLGSSGLIDTYEIKMTDTKTQTFEITNGGSPKLSLEQVEGGVRLSVINADGTQGDVVTIYFDGSSDQPDPEPEPDPEPDPEPPYTSMKVSLSVNKTTTGYLEAIQGVELTWSVSQEVSSVKLICPDGATVYLYDLYNEEIVPNKTYTYTDEKKYIADKTRTWTLQATRKDGNKETIGASANVSYKYRVYCGLSSESNYTDDKFTQDLSKNILTNLREITFYFTGGIDNQYLYFAAPKELYKSKQPTFQIGEQFTSTFSLIGEISVVRDGGEIPYYLYRTPHKLEYEFDFDFYVK